MLLLFWPFFLAATTTAADLPNQGCVRLLRDVSLGREASIMSVISGLIAIVMVNKKYRELLYYICRYVVYVCNSKLIRGADPMT